MGILLADDDKDFVEGVKHVLEDKGYTVFTASDGDEALTGIKQGGVQLLMLDLRMPLINGLDVYLEMRKNDIMIPTIIVTAYASEEHDALMQLGSMEITGVLKKPFDMGELESILYRHFNGE